MTPDALREELFALGFDVVSSLPASLYDGCVPDAWQSERVHPGCRSVALVGHSGQHFWNAFQRSPEAGTRAHPVDRYTRRVLEAWSATRSPAAGLALYLDRRGDAFLPLLSLAQRAGMGAPSRLGLLLHPVLGPWWSLRAALFLPWGLPFDARPLASPCTDCSAPCEPICHGSAVTSSGLDLDACLTTRWSEPACQARCDARLACVVGREHVFGRAQLAHHSRIEWTPELESAAREAAKRLGRSR